VDWRSALSGFALLISVVLAATTIAVADAQIAAERLERGTPLACPDATLKAGALATDPEIQKIELAPPEAEKALETLLEAARTTREGVQSVTAKARFMNWSRGPDDKEFQLITAGRLQLYSAGGKYHLKISHEKMLHRTINLPQGVFPSQKPGEFEVFRNAAGEVVDVPAKMVDWKADRVFIVNDGRSIKSRVFSPRMRPDGVRSESHSSIMEACAQQVGARYVDPAHLVGIAKLDAVVKNLGKEAIQITGLPNGGFRVTYRVKNAPQVRVELDAFAKDGFNISASRVFNEGTELPACAEEVTWKKVNDRWIVSRLSSENRYRGSKHLEYSKEVVVYYSLDVNPQVDPAAFTTESMNDDWQPRAAAGK
jgi:hypothetical protein